MDNKNRLLVGGDKNQLFKTLQNQLVKEEESAIEEFSNVLYWGPVYSYYGELQHTSRVQNEYGNSEEAYMEILVLLHPIGSNFLR